MDIVIPLVENSSCLVKTGQKIDLNEPFLERKSEKTTELQLASLLHIEPKKVFRFLKKFVGDTVAAGDVIAEKKALFGTQKIQSPVSGVIREIEHHHGRLLIQSFDEAIKTTVSYFKGEVARVTDSSITIRVQKAKEILCKTVTFAFGGLVLYLDPKSEFGGHADDTDKKILCTPSLSSYQQAKTEALGIGGFITLHALEEQTVLPHVQVKNIADMQKIFEYRFPYCLIHPKNSSMYFYSP